MSLVGLKWSNRAFLWLMICWSKRVRNINEMTREIENKKKKQSVGQIGSDPCLTHHHQSGVIKKRIKPENCPICQIQNYWHALDILEQFKKFWHKTIFISLDSGDVWKVWEHIFLLSFELSLTLRYLGKVLHKYSVETRSSNPNLLLCELIIYKYANLILQMSNLFVFTINTNIKYIKLEV